MFEMDQANCKNMVSNLPLLFTGGYPTSLERITENQLEKFIPFMVQCSLGMVQIATTEEYSEPEWWPGDLAFTVPFHRPRTFVGNWLEKMRELVVICYSFHKCVFLLRFCTDLSSYEPETLRFINNYNSTTSLYERRTNKLLVTFRNENMLYDQAQVSPGRKCLLPKQTTSHYSDLQQEQMVEPAFFDIYLCDDCDAELYSYDAYMEHEKVCIISSEVQQENVEDDDVIFCGSEVLPTPMEVKKEEANTSEQNMSVFLANFNLRNINNPPRIGRRASYTSFSNSANLNFLSEPTGKLRRLPRRTRGAITLSKCTSIPLSSPCGQFLLKSIKTIMSKDYQIERLERLERFCFAPPLVRDGPAVINRPKWMNRNRMNSNVNISFKKGLDELDCYHDYKFPRRQNASSCRKQNFLFYNRLLLNKCKPCAIILQRLTVQEIENRNIDIRLRRLNIAKSSNRSVRNNAHIVVDCIDLCSSDDEEICFEGKTKVFWRNAKMEDANNSCIRPEKSELKQILFDTATSTQSKFAACQAATRLETNSNSLFASSDTNSNFPQLSTSRLLSDIRNISPSNRSNHVSAVTNTIDFTIQTEDSLSATQRLAPSCSMNLTEVKENRVNDWVNTASTSMESTHHQESHHLSTTSLISKPLGATCLTNSINNNIAPIAKPSPSTIQRTKLTNCVVSVRNSQQ